MTYPYTLRREDWEEPGWRIGEHTRSPALEWVNITNNTIHYPATTNVNQPPTVEKFIQYLRNTQRSYVNNRGYSLGYSAVVWGDLSAEVRGDRWRSASNGNSASNTPSFTIQVRVQGQSPNSQGVDTSQPASPEEVRRVNDLMWWSQNCAGRQLETLGHRDHKATGCPGDAQYAQIQSGEFRPEPITTPVPPGGEDMLNTVRFEGYADQFVLLPVSEETKNRLQIPAGDADVVAAVTNGADLQALFGYPLTPM